MELGQYKRQLIYNAQNINSYTLLGSTFWVVGHFGAATPFFYLR